MDRPIWKGTGQTSLKGHRVWNNLCPLWMFTKEETTEKVLNNPGNKMTSLEDSASLFTKPFYLCPMRLLTKRPWQQECNLYMGSSIGTSAYQGQPDYSHSWVSNPPKVHVCTGEEACGCLQYGTLLRMVSQLSRYSFLVSRDFLFLLSKYIMNLK